MSSSNQIARASASSNFTRIFNSAVDDYKRLTKGDLRTHPFAAALDVCTTPDTILGLFRRQAQIFDGFREGYDKLIRRLNPIVMVLDTLSATLGEGIGLVRSSFLPCILLQHLPPRYFHPRRQYSQASVLSSG
jgi:hypothetical protein